MKTLVGLPPQNELELMGKEMLDHARRNPCLLPSDCAGPEYGRMVAGKYRVSLTLNLFDRPHIWHGSVSILHEIGNGTDLNFGIPEQAILHVDQWPNEEIKNAREILGYAMGPIILEEKQVVQELRALFAIHWRTAVDPRTYAGEVVAAR